MRPRNLLTKSDGIGRRLRQDSQQSVDTSLFPSVLSLWKWIKDKKINCSRLPILQFVLDCSIFDVPTTNHDGWQHRPIIWSVTNPLVQHGKISTTVGLIVLKWFTDIHRTLSCL